MPPPPPPPPPAPAIASGASAAVRSAAPPPPPPPPPIGIGEAAIKTSLIEQTSIDGDVSVQVPDAVQVGNVVRASSLMAKQSSDRKEATQIKDVTNMDDIQNNKSVLLGGPKGHAPFVHGNYDKNEEEEEVMVKTEFVWADGAENDVQLSGAWNGWMTIQMYHEGGGMWSVVTPVPAGMHEFKFVVDGEWKHSTRHPTVGNDEETMNNVRMIRGPPKSKKVEEEKDEEEGQVEESSSNGCCIMC